jgi:uncharacterized membrane protein YdfJ with MMPL/SSD domain
VVDDRHLARRDRIWLAATVALGYVSSTLLGDVLSQDVAFTNRPEAIRAQELTEAWLPLFLFSVLFGLSMDHHVFLLTRIREEYDETGDNTEVPELHVEGHEEPIELPSVEEPREELVRVPTDE